MKKLLFILLLLPVFAMGQTYDKVVESTDSTIVGNEFIYQGNDIELNDVTFLQFSTDSITWHKNRLEADVWMRMSNDNQITWSVTSLNEFDPLFSAWNFDYEALNNKPDIPTQYWYQSGNNLLPLFSESIKIVGSQPSVELIDSDQPNLYGMYFNVNNDELHFTSYTNGAVNYQRPFDILKDGIKPYKIEDSNGSFGAVGQALLSGGSSAGLTWTTMDYGDMYQAIYDPVNINEQLVGLNATQSLTNKTINGVTLNNTGSASLFLNQQGNYVSTTVDLSNYVDKTSDEYISGLKKFNESVEIRSGNYILLNSGGYVKFISRSSAPTGQTSSMGDLWMNSVDNKLYFTNSTTTYDLTNSGTGTADGYVSTVALNGTSLDFTGVLDGFNGSVDLSSLGGGSMIYPGAGIPVSTGSSWGTSITNNSGNWNDAYNNKIVSGEVTGTVTKTITLTQQDGGTVTATFTDLQGTGGGGDVFKDGTPVNNQVGVWTGDGTIEGDANLEWDGTMLSIGNNIRLYQTNGNMVSSAVSTDAIYLAEKSVKPTAAPGTGMFYPKTDGKPYFVNDAGVEYNLSETGSGGISDGDKGDITVSNLGETWNIDPGVVGSTELAPTTISAGTYPNPSITFGADGRATFAQSNTGQVGFSGAKVYCNSTQTATSSGTILSFGGEEYDISGMHSTTNSSRITMPTVYGSASIVEVKFSAQFKALGDITGDVELLKNGSVVKTWDLAQTGLTGQLTINVAENFTVAANDYLEIRVTTSSNSTSATTTALRPAFSVDLITIVT
nr:hypothetical protein [uncultured Draconibacterium sp.]